ncbi:MAG TPA: DUF3466 family protein [Chthonomonadaceae bacterium]|nr:DUF3466 family protein [Chthonomonadaceae bacterium]
MSRTLRTFGLMPACLLIAAGIFWWLKGIDTLQVPGRYVMAQAAPQTPAAGPPTNSLQIPGRQGVVNGHNRWGEEVGVRNFMGHLHAALWKRGEVQDLGTLGGGWSVAYHINDCGEICGDSTTRDHHIHAFLWRQGKMQDLGTLGGNTSHAYCLNDRGQVVGESDTADGFNHAFLYTEGKVQDLGTLGGSISAAYGINNRGQIVGYAEDGVHPFSAAFLWQDRRMSNLNNLLEARSDWRLLEGREINDAGEIHVVGERDKAQQAFLLTPGH